MGIETRITRLRCEYLTNPLGIDQVRPRLSWNMETERRGARQAAYQIKVASSRDQLERDDIDLWNSGRIEDDRSIHIKYQGAPLQSRGQCHWQVRVWDEAGTCTASEPAFWTMGLLDEHDWQARWIAADPAYLDRSKHARRPSLTEPGTPPWIRKTFTIEGVVQRATLYATARGLLECHLNGRRIGEDLFLPEWTDYNRRIQYRTYDVTSLVHSGINALGAALGDGWYSGYVGWQETRGRYGLQNSLMLQLDIEMTGGQRRVIGTDTSWRCSAGPILFSDFMMGETYDARYELSGWSQPGYDDHAWCGVIPVDRPRVPLVAQPNEPVRIIETIEPVSVTGIEPGVYICDLGQNISGWVRLRVQGPAGTTVTLRHGERLNPDGTLYTENLRRARATDVYILKGQGRETWEPHFTFHGFQYIEVTGLPSRPSPGDILGCVIHSAAPPAGHFECSHPLVNRLWCNGYWSQKDNFLSIPTDCPQRDERLGWMGDAQVFLRTATYNLDVAAFFTKWMIDIRDAQTGEGIFPDMAPRLREGDNFVGLDGLGGAAGWADAGVIVPWTIWRVFGDDRIISRHWGAMTAWLDYLERTNPRGIREKELGNNYGDWLCIPSDTTFRAHSPMKTLLATAYWADDAAKLARMASALGKDQEARRFEQMFAQVRQAFQNEWLLEDGRLAVDTQTAYLLALAFNLLPEEVRNRASQHLVENIRNLDWHLSTGFIGIRHLNPMLTVTGHANVAYRLLLNEDYPSWLYPIRHGATTIWERWNGWTEKDGFFDPQMNSFNHYSLGSVGEWLYRSVAGIELDPEVNGFKRFQIKPIIGGGLTHAGATYQSVYGTIKSRWQRRGSRTTLNVTIPPNTRAVIYVPTDPGTDVREAEHLVGKSDWIEILGRQGCFLKLMVPAGCYEFESTSTFR